MVAVGGWVGGWVCVRWKAAVLESVLVGCIRPMLLMMMMFTWSSAVRWARTAAGGWPSPAPPPLPPPPPPPAAAGAAGEEPHPAIHTGHSAVPHRRLPDARLSGGGGNKKKNSQFCFAEQSSGCGTGNADSHHTKRMQTCHENRP